MTLGEIGEIKTSSRPVMHIRIYSAQPVGPLKWRGGALTEFDGKRWTNPRPPTGAHRSGERSRRSGADRRPAAGMRINYHVDLEALDNDALFFAGTPETLDIRARTIYRVPKGRLPPGPPLPQGLHYDAYSLLEDRPETAPPILPRAGAAAGRARARAATAAASTAAFPNWRAASRAGATTDLERARAIERRLRTGYGYTLELPDARSPIRWRISCSRARRAIANISPAPWR